MNIPSRYYIDIVPLPGGYVIRYVDVEKTGAPKSGQTHAQAGALPCLISEKAEVKSSIPEVLALVSDILVKQTEQIAADNEASMTGMPTPANPKSMSGVHI